LTEKEPLTIWDTTKSRPIRKLPTNQQACLNFIELSNGKLAVAFRNNTLKIYNIYTGELERSLSSDSVYIQFLVELPNSIIFTCALNGKKRVYDLKKPTAITQTIVASGGDIYDCAIALKDSLIALGINIFIRVYHVKDLVNELKSLRGHTRPVLDLLLLEDGKTLVSAGQDKTIRVWDWESETCLRTFHHGHTSSVKKIVMIDDSIIASLSIDRFIQIWDFKSGECLKTIDEMKSLTDDMVKKDDGMILTYGAGSHIRFWSGKKAVV